MGNLQISILILILMGVVLFVIFLMYFYSLDIVAWSTAWLFSNKEEKVGLTRAKGHYNANGYLIHSDSDILLDSTGSFKRFDSVDRDIKINSFATTSLTADWNEDCLLDEDVSIPPQPLRPAPVPITTANNSQKISRIKSDDVISNRTTTTISPIPRPVSSVNVATLASQSIGFPVCIPPPIIQMPQQPPQQQQQTQHQQQTQAQQQTQQPQIELIQTEEIEMSPLPQFKRAISCESVCSDTSVALADLEINVTGYLCIGLEYDSECCELVVNILEAKELQGGSNADDVSDSYVRVSFLPDAEATIQTRVYRGSNSPSYKERFLFAMNPREQSQRTLAFHVYSTDMQSHTLIGEGEVRLADVSLRQPVTTWVTLTDTGQKGTEFGELMFSLSYLPTAERLTVVVVKARNLKFLSETPGDPFVKIYLMHQGKKINKKKTSTRKSDRSPIFNEAMIFSVPANTLSTIQLRLTVSEVRAEDGTCKAIGHVIVGAQATGRSLNHWNQMLTALRKPVAMWHSLRK